MATTASISKYCSSSIFFYEGISDFSTTPVADDTLVSLTPSWDTIDSVANTPLLTLNCNNSGAASTNVVIRGVHDPELAQDAATKAYVDGLAVTGVTWKNTVECATTANIATFPPTDGVTTVSTLDGVTLTVGDRVLIKDQTTQTQNGIYEVTAGTWTRTADMATGVSSSGFAVWVDQGNTQSDSGYVVTSDSGADVVDTHAIVWSKFSSAEGVAGVTGDLQFNSGNNGHAAATGGTLNWNDTNFELTVSTDNSGETALIIGTGDISLTEGDIFVADSAFINVGTGNDLSLTHDGSNSTIASTTGNLIVNNSAATSDTIMRLGDAAGATNFILQDSGSVALLTIDSDGAAVHSVGSYTLNDSIDLHVGTGQDLTFSHDGSNSSITNSTGNLTIDQSATGSDLIIEHTGTAAGDDMIFRLGANTTGSSWSFISDSAGTPDTLVTIVAAEEESTSSTTGTLRVVGGIGATGNVSGLCFQAVSDATVKTNITPLSDPLEKIKKLEGFDYNFIEGYGPSDRRHTGLLAQQIETIPGMEHLVSTEPKTGFKTVNYNFVIPILVEAIKQLSDKLEKYEKKN